MTGLEKWAQQHGSSSQEIQALVMAENPDNWKDILGDALSTDKSVPTGRATALAGMLERGRKGDIRVTFYTIAGAMGCSAEVVANAVAARKDGLYGGAITDNDTSDGIGGVKINSAWLPGLLLDVLAEQQHDSGLYDQATVFLKTLHPESAGTPVPAQPTTPVQADPMNAPAAASPQPDTNPGQTNAQASAPAPAQTPEQKQTTQATKPRSGKKTKYSVVKSAVPGLLNPENAQMPVREIRAFLLSLPGAKPVDIALMADQEAMDSFNSSYTAVWMGSGVAVLEKQAYAKLIDLMGSGGVYFIPASGSAE